MEKASHSMVRKVAVLVTFLIMIAVNVLAELLPLNGVTTAQVSEWYPNLFTPAGYTFSIWGLIYLLLAFHTLYQLGVFQKDEHKVNTTLLNQVGILFAISSIVNAAWLFAWHYDRILLSLLLMLILLACLIRITSIIRRESLSLKEKVLIRLPFSLYFGWITIATVANVITFLVGIGWDFFGVPEPIWTSFFLILTLLIGGVTMWRNKDVAYGLVLIWAYIGILVKHISASGFAGQYSLVIGTAIACIVLLIVAEIILLFWKRSKRLTYVKV